jgi:hypothetical protein
MLIKKKSLTITKRETWKIEYENKYYAMSDTLEILFQNNKYFI